MAIGTQLQTVVEMVQDEARLSSATSRGIDHLPHIKRLIRRYHRQMAQEHTWEHLQIKRSDAGVMTAAGQRYYDWPATLDVDRITCVWVRWGGDWDKIGQGITPFHYTIHDSDAGSRSDPVELWDFYGRTQFEVWPMPASIYEVRFEGRKVINALASDSSPLDLDDEMIALFVAAEILAENNQKSADLKLGVANRILGRLKGGVSDGTRIVMGGNDPTSNSRRRGKIYIRSSGGGS